MQLDLDLCLGYFHLFSPVQIRMSIGSVASDSHESSHIWLCDEQGNVHVLRDLEMYTASVNPNLSIKETATTEIDPPTLPSPGPPWSKEGAGFSTVVGGYSGIVCGIQNAELCVRLGVTHDNPLGNSWSKMYCKATDIAVGSYFVVRRTQSGALFTVDLSTIDLTKKKSLLILNWQGIPPCPSDVWNNDDSEACAPTLISLDKYDNFFLIDSTGNVCMYSSLGSRHASWSKVCSAPSIGKRWGILKWLTFWREDEQRGQLSRVSPGKQSVWCSMKNSSPRVFWQLVLSYIQSKADLKLKTNWTRIEIPFEDEMVSFCADKCEVSGIVCAVKTEDTTETLLKYCLNFNSDEAKNVSPLVISGPFSSCKSISICRTSVTSTSSSNHLSVRAGILRVSTGSTSTGRVTSDLKQERSSDVCCENGDCYYCQQAATQPSVSVMLEDSEQRIAAGRKRELEDSEQRIVGGRKRGLEDSEETYPSKRSRVLPISYPLVEGVDLLYKYRTQSIPSEVMIMVICILMLIWLQDIIRLSRPVKLPITVEQVDSQVICKCFLILVITQLFFHSLSTPLNSNIKSSQTLVNTNNHYFL